MAELSEEELTKLNTLFGEWGLTAGFTSTEDLKKMVTEKQQIKQEPKKEIRKEPDVDPDHHYKEHRPRLSVFSGQKDGVAYEVWRYEVTCHLNNRMPVDLITEPRSGRRSRPERRSTWASTYCRPPPSLDISDRPSAPPASSAPATATSTWPGHRSWSASTARPSTQRRRSSARSDTRSSTQKGAGCPSSSRSLTCSSPRPPLQTPFRPPADTRGDSSGGVP